MLIWSTPAKVNLFLNLRGIRDDGFHKIFSVMQTVAIHDRLAIEHLGEGLKINLATDHPDLERGLEANNLTNIVITAYHRFWAFTRREPLSVKISLEKNIPVQAGMGGGSSDAAATLLLLNELLHESAGERLSLDTLEAIGATLGSDVPFFIRRGTAMATGRGELVSPVETQCPSLPLLVVKPKSFGISTAIAYQLYRSKHNYRHVEASTLLSWLESQTSSEEATLAHRIQGLEPLLINDFETVLFAKYPELDRIGLAMKELGINRPLLSGSGPTMIGFIPHETDPDFEHAVNERFPATDYETFVTRTLPQPAAFTAE